MSATRVTLINKAFTKMDVNNEGSITVADLRKLYDTRRHPKVVSGEWTADQVYQEFMTSFQGGNAGDTVSWIFTAAFVIIEKKCHAKQDRELIR